MIARPAGARCRVPAAAGELRVSQRADGPHCERTGVDAGKCGVAGAAVAAGVDRHRPVRDRRRARREVLGTKRSPAGTVRAGDRRAGGARLPAVPRDWPASRSRRIHRHAHPKRPASRAGIVTPRTTGACQPAIEPGCAPCRGLPGRLAPRLCRRASRHAPALSVAARTLLVTRRRVRRVPRPPNACRSPTRPFRDGSCVRLS